MLKILDKLISKVIKSSNKLMDNLIKDSTKSIEVSERPHPEVNNYGLNCDFNLWSEFNKEQLIRNWIKSSREYAPKKLIPESTSPEYEYGSGIERDMAKLALDELIEFGYLDPVTYLKVVK